MADSALWEKSPSLMNKMLSPVSKEFWPSVWWQPSVINDYYVHKYFSRVAHNFFLLGGRKMDLFALKGTGKFTLWPASRIVYCATRKKNIYFASVNFDAWVKRG